MIAEQYISDPNSVGFDIASLPGTGQSIRFAGTYVGQGATARFIIEIGTAKAMPDEDGLKLKMSSGAGAIVSEPGSDAKAMLAALQKALEAKHLPKAAKRVDRVPFDYVILGDGYSQAQDGGISTKPAGNWTAMKIFFGEGEDESEVFLNFNPVSGKAQFSEKDVDYGDQVLAKLASVL